LYINTIKGTPDFQIERYIDNRAIRYRLERNLLETKRNIGSPALTGFVKLDKLQGDI